MKNHNFAEERNLFNKTWRADRRRYIAAGMCESAINEMFALHREQFNSDRRYRTHNQSLNDSGFSDSDESYEDQSSLYGKYLYQLSVSQPDFCEWGRYGWIEDLDNPELARYIKLQSEETIELLTRMVVDGICRADISREMNISRAAVTKRVNPIKNKIEFFLRG